MITKPFKYLVTGLIINVGILFIASSLVLVAIIRNCKGRCGVFWFFGGEGRPGPLSEFMKEELAWILIPLLFDFWWLILLAFAVIPGIGY